MDSLEFFWQTVVVMFFIGLIASLIVGAIFWFGFDQSPVLSNDKSDVPQSNQIDAKKINQVLNQIKTRSADLSNTTTNLPTFVDPSR